VARVHEQVHALIGKLDPYSSPDDIRSAVSKNIAAIIREAKLDLLPYQAKGSEKDAYGKYLLFSSLSLNNVHLREAPFCFQLFYFDPTQTTPIHNHPCECASLVVRGQINERQYVRCGDSKVIKIKKDFRRSGSRCEVDFHEKNSPHSIKNKGVERAITVHVYSIDGTSPNQTVAVKERFLKAPDGRADRKPHEDVRTVMG
ncbi:MAG: Cysteine dioxygenase type, partial [Massilia sp.]|nr:Cysteine dioxygenase type [Massilia sp.]